MKTTRGFLVGHNTCIDLFGDLASTKVNLHNIADSLLIQMAYVAASLSLDESKEYEVSQTNRAPPEQAASYTTFVLQ